ncbi:hypothetical protein DLAC_04176 [Tieghemostelium lacteum]|uniref:Uncharacterized protein n=1 Tax=Tieghemostelium lacteum TaxID=361077 RepID=A0A151ZSA8_TIELA|nr:hypothetical protein DLAC_04176 [Tieghemostelium lacteum]|eukprot:KYQ96867.1 hypothetical protein DLAC_04176 [Tieghemostelium lacteum]
MNQSSKILFDTPNQFKQYLEREFKVYLNDPESNKHLLENSISILASFAPDDYLFLSQFLKWFEVNNDYKELYSPKQKVLHDFISHKAIINLLFKNGLHYHFLMFRPQKTAILIQKSEYLLPNFHKFYNPTQLFYSPELLVILKKTIDMNIDSPDIHSIIAAIIKQTFVNKVTNPIIVAEYIDLILSLNLWYLPKNKMIWESVFKFIVKYPLKKMRYQDTIKLFGHYSKLLPNLMIDNKNEIEYLKQHYGEDIIRNVIVNYFHSLIKSIDYKSKYDLFRISMVIQHIELKYIQVYKPQFIEIFNELCVQVKNFNYGHNCQIFPKEQFGKGISKLIEFGFIITLDQLQMVTDNLPIVKYHKFHFKLYSSHPQILFDNFETILGNLKSIYFHRNDWTCYINAIETLNDILNLPGFLYLLNICPKETYQKYCDLIFDFCDQTKQTLFIIEFLMKITPIERVFKLVVENRYFIDNKSASIRSTKPILELCKQFPIHQIGHKDFLSTASLLPEKYFEGNRLPLETILTDSPTEFEIDLLLSVMRKKRVAWFHYWDLITYLTKARVIDEKILDIVQQLVNEEKSNGGHGFEWLKKSTKIWYYLLEYDNYEFKIKKPKKKIYMESPPKIYKTLDDFLSISTWNIKIRALIETLLYPGYKFTLIVNEMGKNDSFYYSKDNMMMDFSDILSNLGEDTHFCCHFLLMNFQLSYETPDEYPQFTLMMSLIKFLKQLDPNLKTVILEYINYHGPISKAKEVMEFIWQSKITVLKDLSYSTHLGFFINNSVDIIKPTVLSEIPMIPKTILHQILRQMVRFYPFGMNDLYSIAMASKSFFSVVCHLIKNFNLKKPMDNQFKTLNWNPRNIQIGKLIDVHSQFSVLNTGIYHLSTQRLFSFHYQSIETIFYQLTSLEINTSFLYCVDRELPNLLKLTVDLTNNNITMLRNLILYCPILEKIKLSMTSELCSNITTLFEEIFLATKNSLSYLFFRYYEKLMENDPNQIENIKNQCQSFQNQYTKSHLIYKIENK